MKIAENPPNALKYSLKAAFKIEGHTFLSYAYLYFPEAQVL